MPNSLVAEDEPLKRYFETTYIGVPNRNNRGRKQPLFPIALWNCHDRLLNGDPRTTNSVEAWHRAFHNTVGADHPAVYTFFDKLRDEQKHQEVIVDQLQGGMPAPQQRKKVKQYSDRLIAIAEQYDPSDLLGYLKNIAKCIDF